MKNTTVLFIISMIFSPALLAADFVFKVPVNFTELVNISKLKLTCQISNRPTFSQNNVKGSTTVFQNTTGNNVDTMINVPVNIGRNQIMGQGTQGIGLGSIGRGQIKSWQCTSQVCTNPATCRELSTTENQIPFKAKSGAALTMTRSGRI